MTINHDYLLAIQCYIGQNKPKYIVIHETDNFNKHAHALAHAKAHYNHNLATSVHYYVDDGLQGHDAVYQTLTHKDGAYAIGKTYISNPNVPDATNFNTINIEICVNPETNYLIAVANCRTLVVDLIRETGIKPDHVIRHFDAKGKYCPRKMLNDPRIWETFKKVVQDCVEHYEHDGWVKEPDGRWWYARSTKRGDYYKNCMAVIDGKKYLFDEEGYVIGQVISVVIDKTGAVKELVYEQLKY